MSTTPLCKLCRQFSGVTSVLLLAVVAGSPVPVAAQTPTFTLLYSFKGGSGEYPLSGVVADSAGNVYGTTTEGGAHGMGAVYKVNESGEETVLHSFKGGPADGSFSIAGLVRDSVGNLYGTTTDGGAFGFGTVFKVEENGEESLIYSFGSSAKDGRYPSAGLIQDSNGNFYGTTQEGGTLGFGTVFKVTESGEETVLHSFAGNPKDGQYPVQSVTLDASGNIYGATELGGAHNDGTIFKLDTSGHETVIFSFTGGGGGNYPYGGVIRDSAGNFYGTLAYGANEVGKVFKVSAAGKETVLHSFTGGADGAYPSAGLASDSKGNLYGTTEFGGVNGGGVVFSITTAGKLTVLHSFGGSDGADVLTPVVIDSEGNVYGTTTEGGANGQGTVFKIKP